MSSTAGSAIIDLRVCMASAVLILAPVGVSALIGAFCFMTNYTYPPYECQRKCSLAILTGGTYTLGVRRKKLPPEILKFFVEMGKRGGASGGHARAANMTKEERSEAARKAVQARWAKTKSEPGSQIA